MPEVTTANVHVPTQYSTSQANSLSCAPGIEPPRASCMLGANEIAHAHQLGSPTKHRQ